MSDGFDTIRVPKTHRDIMNSGAPSVRKRLMVDYIAATHDRRLAMLRTLILDEKRVDILAKYILDYDPEPFHVRMMEHQAKHDEALFLAFRGAAKTTYLSIARCIAEILWDPNVRILIVSNAKDQAKKILRDIKKQFETNELLRECFGDYVPTNAKWGEDEIIVRWRDRIYKEGTIMCAGSETALPGIHVDIIICDDLVLEEAARTRGQRDKLKTFYYKTLAPILLPRRSHAPEVGGKKWVIGNPWHHLDLYRHLRDNDLSHATRIQPALDDDDRSVWEEQFPTTLLHKWRRDMGKLIFDLQYLCRAEAQQGEIMRPEWFKFYSEAPGGLLIWQGVDLAISQKRNADWFAHVTVGIQRGTKDIYLLDWNRQRLSYKRQVDFIEQQYRRWDPIRVVIEGNAFQDAVRQTLRDDHPEVRAIARFTTVDKVTRAKRFSAIPEMGRLFVKVEHEGFVDFMCSVPSSNEWDVFDATDIAITQGMRGVRKKREPVGLL